MNCNPIEIEDLGKNFNAMFGCNTEKMQEFEKRNRLIPKFSERLDLLLLSYKTSMEESIS
jgi:hypothetical protein